MMKAYSGIASIYDDLMLEDVDYNSWIEFIEEKINKKRVSILELACGTGNITIELAKRGYKMTGVDISEEMLTVASQKTNMYNIKWINQDMAELALKDKYDAIICPCDGFNYITDIETLEEVINNIKSLLNDDGKLIFDISSKYKLKNILANNTFAESFEDNAYIWENFYDDENDICEFEVTTFERTQDNFSRNIEYHCQKAYDIKEITEVLKNCGFRDIHVHDGYTDNEKVASNCERLVFTCNK